MLVVVTLAGGVIVTIRSELGGRPFVPLTDILSPVEPDEDAVPVTVLTWNIRWGTEEGPDANNWTTRRKSFRNIFAQMPETDILCFQEALEEQLQTFDHFFPNHARVGAGREDGRSRGEHCAIYYHSGRFLGLESGTFWLSDTPGTPSRAWNARYFRICTWIRLKARKTGRTFLVFNTHFPLRGYARERSAEVLVTRIEQEKLPHEPVLLAGDLNCGPGSDPRKILAHAGLKSTEFAGRFTFHWRGIGLASLDAILVSSGWRIVCGGIIKEKGGQIYPSDHYGVRVELQMPNHTKSPRS